MLTGTGYKGNGVRYRFSLVIIVGGEKATGNQVRIKDLRCGAVHQYMPEEVVSNALYLLQLKE